MDGTEEGGLHGGGGACLLPLSLHFSFTPPPSPPPFRVYVICPRKYMTNSTALNSVVHFLNFDLLLRVKF